ncbi:MAG: endonuclease/exonuclease/phosphatase family protein [Spirochaetaceae bacterium]|jgi:endonuclease/exonuclease/phosphatase family metal-dependent hydrolase|nr:endonuclease/exonuclease/phosphatase family protein [Spirochaetaceae bacterium]
MDVRWCALGAGFFLAAACSCGGGGKGPAGELSIASWNVQALFDESDDGGEYAEYRSGAGWSDEKYAARLYGIGAAIGAMGGGGPDVAALLELENRGVAEDLAGAAGYGYCFFAGNGSGALGVGALSRLPFVRARAHSIAVDGAVIPRPVLELALETEGDAVTFFVCHWKSKSGGAARSEVLRREAARVILRRLSELRAEDPAARVVVLGDLNESFDEFFLQGGGVVCALMPDDAGAARAAAGAGAGDFLIVSGQKPPCSVFFAGRPGVFYSPWYGELKNGSFYYKGGWETLDHVLLDENCFGDEGWRFKDCVVLDGAPFTNARGEPDRYNPRTGSGLSDHLPLLLTLTRAPPVKR